MPTHPTQPPPGLPFCFLPRKGGGSLRMSPHVDPRRHVNAAASLWFTAASELAHTPAQRVVSKSTLFVIHAKVDGTSEGKVKLNSKSSWVRNNTIVVPCDGIYLVYAHISSQNNHAPRFKIMKKGTPDSVETWHLVDAKESSPMAMSELRINESIYMTLELSSETFDQAESYLGIALLEVLQNVKSCRQLLSRKS